MILHACMYTLQLKWLINFISNNYPIDNSEMEISRKKAIFQTRRLIQDKMQSIADTLCICI